VSAERKRRIASLVLVLVLVAVAAALVMSDPFGAPAKPGGVADNATTTSLVTVRRQALSSRMQVNATLGYAGASSIRVPSGTAPSAVRQAQQSVSSSEGMLSTARASLAADGATLANVRATVVAAREKEAVDCAGDGPAESAASPSAEAAAASPSSGGGASGACAGDVQALAGDEQSSNGDALKLSGDHGSVASARAALASARAAAQTVRSTAADYEQGSTFTMLARVGQRIARGGELFALGGEPTVLLYGSVVPSRAFLAGMSAGGDVAELNANLQELGYGGGLSGDTFSSATEAAIRAFQLAHGMTATGELPLGSVVFERGAVLVTSVTPEVGASVAPGPVLGIASTVAQVSIALSAAQQSSVKVGDRVSIALPNNVTTPGVVSSVGTVAKAPASKEGGGGGGGENEEGAATIEVDVRPSDPSATGHLDEAPVTVSITTASVGDALVVPIDALLALAGGGYALEVSEGGVRHLEAVTLGTFDDAEGLVQVGGASVSAGQRVVVPAS
jgi:peptidoglycan hydrolase-like protein with peptidoglycan-binding domain